jgi:hypothetical protein
MSFANPDQCPQCTLQGQSHFHGTTDITMQVSCVNGHVSNVILKFDLKELTFIDTKSGRLIRYDKIKKPEKPNLNFS